MTAEAYLRARLDTLLRQRHQLNGPVDDSYAHLDGQIAELRHVITALVVLS